jgi:Tn3 transposase DDE domain
MTLAQTDLVDVLIDIDNETDFLRHFLHCGGPSRLPVAERRRNILAALIAIGCNLGPQRMAVASGLSVREISEVADWYLTEDALKAASIDLVNYASNLPLSPIYGRGASCSADGLRFYVPLNLLAADYSPCCGIGVNSLCAHR